MKFDVVIGNPPYQSPEGTKNVKIWPTFFEKCLDLLNEHGILSYITPTTHFWSLERSWQTGRAARLLYSCNIKSVNFTTSDHFKQVGDYICHYSLVKEPPEGLAKVVQLDGQVVMLEQDDIYDSDDQRKRAKFLKAMSNLRGKFGKYRIPHDLRDSSHYRLDADGIYQHPTYISAAKVIHYADSPTLGLGQLKIILNMSSYFWHVRDTERYMRLDDGPGVGLLGRMIAVETEAEGREIMDFLQSRVVKFFIDCMKRTSPWNHAMYQIPRCHHLTEQELLEEIGMSTAEFDTLYPPRLNTKV